MRVDTLLVFTLAIPSSAPQQTAGLWGVLTRSVCVCMCVCVFFLSFRLARQTEPGSSAKVKTRGSSFRDRQERQKVRQRVLSGVCFFHVFLAS